MNIWKLTFYLAVLHNMLWQKRYKAWSHNCNFLSSTIINIPSLQCMSSDSYVTIHMNAICSNKMFEFIKGSPCSVVSHGCHGKSNHITVSLMDFVCPRNYWKNRRDIGWPPPQPLYGKYIQSIYWTGHNMKSIDFSDLTRKITLIIH